MPMNIYRRDFRNLALMRLKEAKVLLDRGKYSGAYYLCGYSLECGLKACIAKKIKRSQFPDLGFVKDCWVHNLRLLVKAAALNDEWEKKKKSDKQFLTNWGVVKDWDVNSRYKKYNKKVATDFYNAVADDHNGVLQSIKLYW